MFKIVVMVIMIILVILVAFIILVITVIFLFIIIFNLVGFQLVSLKHFQIYLLTTELKSWVRVGRWGGAAL
jgi:hypothetical protein